MMFHICLLINHSPESCRSSSQVFVALLGKEYMQSTWCKKELEIATRRSENGEVTILPYRVDRSDVSEELARLDSHLAALGDLLAAKGPVGKRIEFLLQEVLREVNTIGSKANHLPVTQAVLDAKGEIEKLREQVANVE